MFRRKNTYKEILKDAPGPSPWYIREFPPRLDGFNWIEVPDDDKYSGIIILKNDYDEICALFDFYNYILPLKSGNLLIWHQPYENKSPTKDIECTIIDPRDLIPLGKEITALCMRLRDNKCSNLLENAQKIVFQIPTTTANQTVEFIFPEEAQSLSELLIICHSSGISTANGCEEQNIGIMVAEPKKNLFKIIPQDWFNKGGLDYGYQWITRVARGKDRKIYGEGIRIPPFCLDKTMRNIEKTYK